MTTCKSCRYWEPWPAEFEGDEPDYGNCKFNPPTIPYNENTIYAEWPITEPTSWCGQHKEQG